MSFVHFGRICFPDSRSFLLIRKLSILGLSNHVFFDAFSINRVLSTWPF